MIYITGQVGERSYNEEPVQPGFLLDLFKGYIPDPREGIVDFRIDSRHRKIDQFGQKNVPANLQIPTKFDGTCQLGDEILNLTIQYATTRTRENAGGFKYTPARLASFSGEAIAFTSGDIQVLDQYVYYALNPLNANSPFHQQGKRALYGVYDRMKEAKDRNALLAQLNKVQQELFTTDEAILKIKAAGLNYRVPGGRGINGFGHGMGKDELVNELSQLLQRDKQHFIYGWNDQSNMLRGMILYALDINVLTQGTGPAGGPSFSWTHEPNGGIIVECSRTDDPITRLLSRFSDDAGLVSVLRKSIDSHRVAVAPSKSVTSIEPLANLAVDDVKSVDPAQLIATGLAKEAIFFDRSSAMVILVDSKGEETPVYEHKQGDTKWADAFAKALRSPKYFKAKQQILDRINELQSEPIVPADESSDEAGS